MTLVKHIDTHMGLFGWLKRSGNGANARIETWRTDWNRAAAAVDAQALAPLRAALEAHRPLAPDLEIEEEMLEGLERHVTLTRELHASQLPVVDTTHRVVGADRCHYSAPASMPDDPAQPSGRLLLTSSRAVFIGGARLTALAWHAAAQVGCGERDLLLVRSDGQVAHRFRCNSYADALCGAAIARHLMQTARDRRPIRSADL